MGPFELVGKVFNTVGSIADGVDQYALAFAKTGIIVNNVLDVEGEMLLAESSAKLEHFRATKAKELKAVTKAA